MVSSPLLCSHDSTKLWQRSACRAAVGDHSATATSHRHRCQTGLLCLPWRPCLTLDVSAVAIEFTKRPEPIFINSTRIFDESHTSINIRPKTKTAERVQIAVFSAETEFWSVLRPTLHWLPIEARIQYKIRLLVHLSLNGEALSSVQV